MPAAPAAHRLDEYLQAARRRARARSDHPRDRPDARREHRTRHRRTARSRWRPHDFADRGGGLRAAGPGGSRSGARRPSRRADADPGGGPVTRRDARRVRHDPGAGGRQLSRPPPAGVVSTSETTINPPRASTWPTRSFHTMAACVCWLKRAIPGSRVFASTTTCARDGRRSCCGWFSAPPAWRHSSVGVRLWPRSGPPSPGPEGSW